MCKQELFRRYLFFLIGLFVNSFGISFVTKSALGTSPISSVPYTLSLGFRPTLGMFTLYMSIVLVVLQLLIMQKQFPKQYFLQIPISFLFSYFIDISMQLLSFLDPQVYPMKLFCLLVGCSILGFGVFMEMVADVAMLPGECFVNAVSKTFHTDFGKTKIIFDSSMTLLAVAISFVLYKQLRGVREGTLIAAFLVGMIARTCNRKIGTNINQLLQVSAFSSTTTSSTTTSSTNTSHPLIITISREYGSGGRKVAKHLAKQLGLAFYDRQIISQAAKELGLPEAEIEAKEQKMHHHLLYDMFAQFYEFSDQKATSDKLYTSEKQVIRSAAEQGNCIIVGRCANVICQDLPNTYHFFLYADDEHKIREIMQREQMDYTTAKKHMLDVNKKRFNHYKYYTGGVWGLSQNYDCCIDTSMIGITQTCALIRSYIAAAQAEKAVQREQ